MVSRGPLKFHSRPEHERDASEMAGTQKASRRVCNETATRFISRRTRSGASRLTETGNRRSETGKRRIQPNPSESTEKRIPGSGKGNGNSGFILPPLLSAPPRPGPRRRRSGRRRRGERVKRSARCGLRVLKCQRTNCGRSCNDERCSRQMGMGGSKRCR